MLLLADQRTMSNHVKMPKHSTTRLSNFFGLIIIIILSCCELVGAQEAQKPMYQEKTSEQCSNLAGGSSIKSIAECNQAAAGLGWSDVVVDIPTGSWSHTPPGCVLYHSQPPPFHAAALSNAPAPSSAHLVPTKMKTIRLRANHVLRGSINK